MTPHYSRRGDGPALILLHATLSSSRQLRSLAARLAGHYTVVSVDRRGSGRSATEGPAQPIGVATHIEDLASIMAAEDLGPALVVGHSYGGCIALELAARRPELVSGVFGYEPPYLLLASPESQAHMASVARRMLAANEQGDLETAALTFMEGVSGPEAVAALSPAARARIGRAGQGAVSDATLLGMDPDGLSRIDCPVRVCTGGASQPLYAEIAEAIQERIGGAEHRRLEGLDHMAPITKPDVVADAIASWAQR